MNGLADSDAATARSRAYLLLGRLYLRGITGDVLEHVRAVRPLADRLGSFGSGESGEFDADEAAASSHDVFGFNVFPYQSTFLDETGRAGGRETERVTDFYRRAGFPIVETAETPDHLGVELNFLGFLSKMEAEHSGDDAEAARELSRRFLDEHLLHWIQGLRHALHVHGQPFFAALGDLTVETLLDHRRALGDRAAPPSAAEPEEPRSAGASNPPGPELLDEPKTGLRDIGEYLLVPAKSGIYLSRGSIRALSRRGNLPAGFGARDDMMGNLLRSAADYDGLESLTERLLAHVADTRRAWENFGDEIPADVTGPAAESWLERLDATEALLRKVRRAASA